MYKYKIDHIRYSLYKYNVHVHVKDYSKFEANVMKDTTSQTYTQVILAHAYEGVTLEASFASNFEKL